MKKRFTQLSMVVLCMLSTQLFAQTAIENFDQNYSLGNVNSQGPIDDVWGSSWYSTGGLLELVDGSLGASNGYSIVANPSGRATATTVYFRDLKGDWTDDGSTMWVSFYMQRTNTATEKRYGGLALFNENAEALFIGSASSVNMIGFHSGNYADVPDDQLNHILIKLKMNGDPSLADDAYVWVNYAGTTEPAESTALITKTWGKNGFTRIRISCHTAYEIYFDDIRISKDSWVSTGIHTVKNQSITISPNPVINNLNFSVTADEVVVYGLDGKIAAKAFDANSIDLSELPKGIYIAKLSYLGETITEKIIKK